MERDSRDRGEGRLTELHPIGHARAEVAGHSHYLGMVRVARPGACDAIAGGETTDLSAYLNHDSGRAVSAHRLL